MADATGVKQYSGIAAQSALNVPITNSTLGFAITVVTGWPDGSIGNFVATIDPGQANEEKILCSSLSGSNITVVQRGYDGTTAQSHASGAIIIHTVSSIDLAEANWIANFHARTAKASGSLADTDELPMADSGATYGLVKLTLANLKAFLKTYFDGFYKFAVTTVSASQAVAANSSNYVRTDLGAYTLTLPASANLDDEIRIFDAGGNAVANNITINFNGLKFQGTAGNTLVMDSSRSAVYLKYSGATDGWELA